MAKKPKTRPIRPAARSFDHFPEDSVCPICRTSDDGECVLVQIDGTGDGKIAEAAPMHMSCAVASNFNKVVGVIYRRVA